MTHLRRATCVAVLSALVLSGCSDDDTSTGAADLSAPVREHTTIDDLVIPGEPAPGAADGDGPATQPETFALQFQSRVYAGDSDACRMLAPGSRMAMVAKQVAAGLMSTESSCADYVEIVASNYPQSKPEVKTGVVEQDADSATVLVERLLDGVPSETTMTLKAVDGQWQIAGWGTF